MLVSGIIPCHNHRDWVMDAIKGIATQDYEHKNVIVVDDGSTDKSLDTILNSLQRVAPGHPQAWRCRFPGTKTDVFVMRFDQAKGPAFARNRGMELAVSLGAELFALCDSDDEYQPGKISKSVRFFREFPEVGVVYSDYDTVRTDGLRIREYKQPYSRRALLTNCIINCDSVVSKDAINYCGGFDESLRVCEDFNAWLSITERYVAVHIPESLVTLRVGHHSSTSTVSQEVWNDCYRRVMQRANA